MELITLQEGLNMHDKPEIPNSNSQYSGTKKNTVCTRCDKVLNHLSPEEQENHSKECMKQSKLF
jgi:hypothetical protein